MGTGDRDLFLACAAGGQSGCLDEKSANSLLHCGSLLGQRSAHSSCPLQSKYKSSEAEPNFESVTCFAISLSGSLSADTRHQPNHHLSHFVWREWVETRPAVKTGTPLFGGKTSYSRKGRIRLGG